MRLVPMEINASLIFLWVSALWQLAPIDALTARQPPQPPCPSPECKLTKSNLRSSLGCNCDVWQKQWSANYKQYYWSNRVTGELSFEAAHFEEPLNFEAKSQKKDVTAKSQKKDVTTQGRDILKKGGLDDFGKKESRKDRQPTPSPESQANRSKLVKFGAKVPVSPVLQRRNRRRRPSRTPTPKSSPTTLSPSAIADADAATPKKVWERHWSNYQQKYFWIDRETGKYSWTDPYESYDIPRKAETRGPDILNQGGRTPEEMELLNEVEQTWFNLQKNLVTQDQITDYIGCMDSPQGGIPSVDSHVQATEAEGSPVMANFLGDMWKEMRMFKNPFLKEQLLEHRMKLQQMEPGLRQEYKAALIKMKRQEEMWANDEDATSEDRVISRRNAAYLDAGLSEMEEAAAYDEEEDAKLNDDDEEDARDAADETRLEKVSYKKYLPATRTVTKDPKDRLLKPWWMRGLEDEKMKYEVSPQSGYDIPAKEEYDIPKKVDDKDATDSATTSDDAQVIQYVWYWPWTWSWPWSPRKLQDRWKARLPVTSEEEGPPQPMFTEQTMPSISTSVHCVMLLAWVYFIVFTMIALARTVNQLTGNQNFSASLTIQTTLEKVKQFVEAVPVLCVLFLAVRFRAIELCDGDTQAYDLPQPYVKLGMFAASYGLTFQIIFTLIRILVFGKVDNATGQITYVGEPKPAIIAFVAVKYVFLMCIYIGVMAVCVGAINMPVPKEVWGDSSPPVNSSLTCVVLLSCIYFVVDFVVASLRIAGDDVMEEWGDNITPKQKAGIAFTWTKPALNLVPMLGVLFLVFHTWGLETDLWGILFLSEACMYLITAAMILQVVFSIILTSWAKDSLIEKPALQNVPGIVCFRSDNMQWKTFCAIVRRLSALFIYGGSFTLIFIGSEYAFRAVSATMRCTIGLTFLYFLVIAVIFWLHAQKGSTSEQLQSVARTSVLVPMLCLVFMAARIRVLQLTRTTHGDVPPGAAPQRWVQNAMYFASLAMILQLFMAYLTGSCAVEDPSILQEEDKRSMSPARQAAISIAVAMHLCLVFMLFGVLVVMVGVVVMTPETLAPYGEGRVFASFVR